MPGSEVETLVQLLELVSERMIDDDAAPLATTTPPSVVTDAG